MTDNTLTPKAKKTRREIFEVAIRLFTEQGYDQTTMRDIAQAADRSLGLTYRYFDSKEALVLVLWEQTSQDLTSVVDNLPEDTITERFYIAMKQKIEALTPYRSILIATLGAAMSPTSGVGVISPQTTGTRDVVLAAFDKLVRESSDAPRESLVEPIVMIMYTVHLLTTLTWLYDKSEAQATSDEMLSFMQDTMKLIRPTLYLPPVAKSLARIATILENIFSPEKA